MESNIGNNRGVATIEQRTVSEPRCPMAMAIGQTIHSRCALRSEHELTGGTHVAWGLTVFPYQTYIWYPGHRREYLTDRADVSAWEVPQ